MSNFSCSLTRNITSHSMKSLAFHSLLRLKMIVLSIRTTSLIQLSCWENVLLSELRSGRVKPSLRLLTLFFGRVLFLVVHHGPFTISASC